jgi:uncharacterized protein DUF6527
MADMRRDDCDVWPDDVPIGTFTIEDGAVGGYPGATAHILFVCPNRIRCAVLLGPANVPKPNEDSLSIWQWNGDKDKPTLYPSINCKAKKDNGEPAGGCGWHGFITNGKID